MSFYCFFEGRINRGGCHAISYHVLCVDMTPQIKGDHAVTHHTATKARIPYSRFAYFCYASVTYRASFPNPSINVEDLANWSEREYPTEYAYHKKDC